MEHRDDPTSTPALPRPATRRGRATRDAFIVAARERFLVDGYLNATVPEIAATAQRSPASFYTYFQSKADLLRWLSDEAIVAIESALADALEDDSYHSDIRDLIVRMSTTIWTAYRDQMPALLSIFQVAMRDLELDPWIRLRQVLVAAIEQVGERAVAAGAEAPSDPSVTARSIASMLEYTSFVWLNESDEPLGRTLADEEAIAVLAQTWAAALGLSF